MSEPTIIDVETEDIEEAVDENRQLWQRIKFLEAKVDTMETITKELIQAHGRTLKEFVQMIEAMADTSGESSAE
tara:strand:- start:4586 stop:4807 length:222 start_codon:yes stop_codon:yes gene_type:complete